MIEFVGNGLSHDGKSMYGCDNGTHVTTVNTTVQ